MAIDRQLSVRRPLSFHLSSTLSLNVSPTTEIWTECPTYTRNQTNLQTAPLPNDIIAELDLILTKNTSPVLKDKKKKNQLTVFRPLIASR